MFYMADLLTKATPYKANFPKYFKLAIFQKTSRWQFELLFEVKRLHTYLDHILIRSYTYLSYTRYAHSITAAFS